MTDAEKLIAELHRLLVGTLEREIERRDAEICQLREALELVVCDFEMRSPMDIQCEKDAERSKICLAALSSTGPCPHEEEIKRLREALNVSPESLARCFHHHYERLAPEYRYETRDESRTDWDSLPRENKGLMKETAKEVLAELRRRAKEVK